MNEIEKGEQGRINITVEKAIISCPVAYYEGEEQARAILSVCNNH